MQESKTLNRVREAREAISTAQNAMDKAQRGLAGVESVAEKADQVRRHPLATTAIIFALGLVATLTFIGIRNSDDG